MKDKDYINVVNNMNISEEYKNKLLRKIRNSNKKESFIMIKKKIILAAAAAVMIIGAAPYASSAHTSISPKRCPPNCALPPSGCCVTNEYGPVERACILSSTK